MNEFGSAPSGSPLHESKQSNCLLVQYYEEMVLLFPILCLAFVQSPRGAGGGGAKNIARNKYTAAPADNQFRSQP
jgi:hypothetical protein